MNIRTVIEYLNNELGYGLSSEYYTKYIAEWVNWWKGYHKPFHHFKELSDQRVIERDMYTLKMAKKVCEDWAAILLNEKTEIVIEDKTSSEFIQGKDGTGGVFSDNDFWVRANDLVERAFMSGSGAFVLRLNGMTLSGNQVVKDKDTKIRIHYVTATNMIPISMKNGIITEIAFVSDVLDKGKSFIYLETHSLDGEKYVITNQYFRVVNDQMEEVPLPGGIAPMIHTGSSIPWFSVISPNIVNNIDGSNGLGISVFANAIDSLKGVDLAFNNFCRDLKLGGKKVFLNQSLTRRDESGAVITPDDVAQQLFVQVGEEYIGENGSQKMIHEFNPDLRVQGNKDAVQSMLDYLSFKCGLGTKHYQFNAGSIVTATQYMGDKQELVQNASKHYIVVERSLKELVRAILWAGREVLGESVDPETQITVNFEDSYVIDKESERLRDQQEIRDGLMQKWEYRVKWYGEDEETAKMMVGSDLADDDLMGFGGANA